MRRSNNTNAPRAMIEPIEQRTLLSAGATVFDVQAAPLASDHGENHHQSPAMSRQHSGKDHRARQQVMTRKQRRQAARQHEIHFMREMIDHHQMAIDMGEMAVEKAVHPELKALGEAIVTTQTAEIQQMQSWLKEWYGIDHTPQLKRGDQTKMDRLEKLSGDDFEIAFLREMIRHHSMAVMMSQHVLRFATHQELRDLANDIIEAQSAEIEQMTDWLGEWYGLTAGGHGGHARHMGSTGSMGGGHALV